MLTAPTRNPCGSCPYRRDVPSGIWSREEYDKLPLYDEPTGEQPPAVFLCHQQNNRVCAGWAAVHDMEECLALRLATCMGRVGRSELEAIRNYTTVVPLFGSGKSAAEHGRRNMERPGRKAVRAIAELVRKRKAKT